MSFTDQNARITSEEDLKSRWYGGKPGEYFRCGFCGYKFNPGDLWRCVYTNDTPGAAGNPLVCEICDAPREVLIDRWKKMRIEAKTKFWFFTRNY